MTTATDQELLKDIARDIIMRVAPQETPIFPAAADTYFANPRRALRQSRSRDSVLGFGLDSFAIVLTPAVLHILSEVLGYLAEIARKAIENSFEKKLSEIIRGMFRKHSRAPGTVLTAEQIAGIHERALSAAKSLKLPRGKAELLADAIIAELVIARE